MDYHFVFDIHPFFGLSNTIIHHFFIAVNKKLLTTSLIHAILSRYDEERNFGLATKYLENHLLISPYPFYQEKLRKGREKEIKMENLIKKLEEGRKDFAKACDILDEERKKLNETKKSLLEWIATCICDHDVDCEYVGKEIFFSHPLEELYGVVRVTFSFCMNDMGYLPEQLSAVQEAIEMSKKATILILRDECCNKEVKNWNILLEGKWLQQRHLILR